MSENDDIKVKAEKALIAYLQASALDEDGEPNPTDPLHGHQFYEGHGAVDNAVLPRSIVVFSGAGGGTAYKGIHQLTGELQTFSKSDDAAGQSARLLALEERIGRAALSTILEVLNKPEAPDPDERTVKFFGVSALWKSGDTQEGRDTENSRHGAVIPLTIVCNHEVT